MSAADPPGSNPGPSFASCISSWAWPAVRLRQTRSRRPPAGTPGAVRRRRQTRYRPAEPAAARPPRRSPRPPRPPPGQSSTRPPGPARTAPVVSSVTIRSGNPVGRISTASATGWSGAARSVMYSNRTVRTAPSAPPRPALATPRGTPPSAPRSPATAHRGRPVLQRTALAASTTVERAPCAGMSTRRPTRASASSCVRAPRRHRCARTRPSFTTGGRMSTKFEQSFAVEGAKLRARKAGG